MSPEARQKAAERRRKRMRVTKLVLLVGAGLSSVAWGYLFYTA
jgi:hypothetical protein